MSPTASPTTHPSLAQLAEVIHRGTEGDGGAVISFVRADPAAEAVSFGFWSVPARAVHPVDPLIGFLAPASWQAIGLTTTGRLHHLDGAHGPVAVRATVLAARDGRVSSLVDRADGALQALDTAPQGWAADALARALARPTPPPAEPLSAFVEATWLDQVAARVLDRPGATHRWGDLARLHPLAPPGAPATPERLAEQARTLDRESSWARMRQRYGGAARPQGQIGDRPPGGRPTSPEDWFDDGSFCRWAQRDLPPTDAVLAALTEVLPEALARQLRQGLRGGLS